MPVLQITLALWVLTIAGAQASSSSAALTSGAQGTNGACEDNDARLREIAASMGMNVPGCSALAQACFDPHYRDIMHDVCCATCKKQESLEDECPKGPKPSSHGAPKGSGEDVCEQRCLSNKQCMSPDMWRDDGKACCQWEGKHNRCMSSIGRGMCHNIHVLQLDAAALTSITWPELFSVPGKGSCRSVLVSAVMPLVASGTCTMEELHGEAIPQCGCAKAVEASLQSADLSSCQQAAQMVDAVRAQIDAKCGAKAESEIVSMAAAPEAKGTTSLHQHHCSLETSGTCHIFGCAAARGATNCIGGKCLCTLGNCATSDGSTCRPQCNTMTTGTCRVFGCGGSRGATNCVSGKCVCQAGYCATGDGESCSQSNPDVAVAMEEASLPKSQPLILALFVGIAAGFVSTAGVLLAWARYSRNTADDQAYIQIE